MRAPLRLARRCAVWLAATVMVLAIGLAAGLVAAHAAGLSVYIVTSGSMEPSVPMGALVLVAPEPAGDVGVGDVITFVLPDRVVTHRVVAIEPSDSGPVFVTRGDANPAPDPARLEVRGVVGVPRLVVPDLGFVVAYAQSYWRILVLAVIAWSLVVEARSLRHEVGPLRGARA